MNLLCASLCVHVQSEVTWSEWDNNHLLLIWRLPLFHYHESGWFQVNEILITCHCRQHFLYIYDNFFLSFYWNQCWLNQVILISNLTVCSQEWNASEHYWYTEHAEIGKKKGSLSVLGCWLGWRWVRAARCEIFLIALQTGRVLGLGLGKWCQNPWEASAFSYPSWISAAGSWVRSSGWHAWKSGPLRAAFPGGGVLFFQVLYIKSINK